MSYNKKVWLAVPIFCAIFWLLAIGSLYLLNKKFGPERPYSQSESIAKIS
ncbi:hypothetical protein [Serratia oryzae]|nr:hypothetical protein [Serratia oryzae]